MPTISAIRRSAMPASARSMRAMRERGRLRPQRPVAARGHRAREEICALRRTQPHLGDARRPRQAQRPAARWPMRPIPCPRRHRRYCRRQDLELDSFASVEAQLAALADDIAYNNHDIDDGYRAGLFTFAELAEVPIAGRALAEVRAAYPGLDGTRLLYEAIRRLITAHDRGRRRRDASRRLERLSPMQRRRRASRGPRPWSPSRRRCQRSRRLARLSLRPRLPPSAHRAHHGEMPRASCATSSRATAPTRGAAAGMARAGAGAQSLCPPCLRFHRRHDRPLRARRASAPV